MLGNRIRYAEQERDSLRQRLEKSEHDRMIAEKKASNPTVQATMNLLHNS